MMAFMMEYAVNPDDAPEATKKWLAAFFRVAGITDLDMLYESNMAGLVQFFFRFNGETAELIVARDMFENMNKYEIEIYIGQRLMQSN